MQYDRVLPRDLFNEAKLLKCLGQLALHLHDYEGRWPVKLDLDQSEETGFVIWQNPDDASLYCANLKLMRNDGVEIGLYSAYNSKGPYPLWFYVDGQSDYDHVFNDDGGFTAEFLKVLEG